MWKHYQLTLEEPRCRSCGTFSVYAGSVLLGKSDLESETIDEDGFLREGDFDAVLESYLRFQDAFIRYQDLKLQQQLRVPAYKHIPELEASKRVIESIGLRLVAPNGDEVPTECLEVVDLGDGRSLEVFITDELVYVRYFPPDERNA